MAYKYWPATVASPPIRPVAAVSNKSLGSDPGPAPYEPLKVYSDSVASEVDAGITASIEGLLSSEYEVELSDSRQYRLIDVDDDGHNEVAVLFDVNPRGGNSWTTHLAVYRVVGRALTLMAHVSVGGKGSRYVAFVPVPGPFISLAVQDYAPDDPMCCPTLGGTTSYALQGGTLVEGGDAVPRATLKAGQ